ncbi:MAG: YrhB domain-containing protein [Anaerolineae bacterium]
MIGKVEAKKLAKDFLDREYSLPDDEYVILDEHTQETDTAWKFLYDSKLFIETGDPQYFLMIRIPLLVDKSDGTCTLMK